MQVRWEWGSLSLDAGRRKGRFNAKEVILVITIIILQIVLIIISIIIIINILQIVIILIRQKCQF